MSDITINGHTYKHIATASDGSYIYQDNSTGVILKYNPTTRQYENNIHISAAELNTIKGIDGSNTAVDVTVGNDHLTLTQIGTDAAGHPIYASTDANGNVTIFNFVPASGSGATAVPAHFESVPAGTTLPAGDTGAITGATPHVDTFKLPGHGDTLFHRQDGNTIVGDDGTTLSLDQATGNYVSGGDIVPGYAVAGAENNGAASILYNGKLITPVTVNGHTTYFDQDGNVVLEERGTTDVFTDSETGATVQQSELDEISNNTLTTDNLRLDPVYGPPDATGHRPIVSYNLTTTDPDTGLVTTQNIPYDPATGIELPQDMIPTNSEITKAEHTAHQEELDHQESFTDNIVIGALAILSAGLLSMAAGIIRYAGQRKDHKKKIDALVQDAYQEQINSGQEPNSRNFDEKTKKAILDAHESFQNTSASSMAFSTGFAFAAAAGIVVLATALTGGMGPALAAIVGALVATASAAIGAGLGYYGGKTLATRDAGKIYDKAILSEENLEGNKKRKAAEKEKVDAYFDIRHEKLEYKDMGKSLKEKIDTYPKLGPKEGCDDDRQHFKWVDRLNEEKQRAKDQGTAPSAPGRG